jgi:hypothetical protein
VWFVRARISQNSERLMGTTAIVGATFKESQMRSLANRQDAFKFWIMAGVSLILISGNPIASYGQGANSGASASAGASGASGGDSAGANSSASATAGPNDSGGVTASASGTAGGSATGGDTSTSEPGISADATASSGDTATAETSTSAGTSAEASAGDVRDAEATGGTVISKEHRNKGYAISYQDGAYSVASYKKDTAYATSGIYSGETLSKKDAQAIIRNGGANVSSGVEVGASADADEASAYANSGTDALGSDGSETSRASTRTKASAQASTDGEAAGTAGADFSASVGAEE